MRLNHWRYRLFSSGSHLRVHLGCGQVHYLNGWLNVDGNILSARPDLWIDLTHGLPFPDNSVQVFYSHHVLEHLTAEQIAGLFREMFRCLEPGGGVRVGVPHAGNAYRMYVEGRHDWFSDFPQKRRSLGGRCSNFLLCANEHLCLLDFSYLEELLTKAGFVGLKECLPSRESSLVGAEVLQREGESNFDIPHTLIIEAKKPSPPAYG
jgi:predicted SAM-dependent methyltransferase